jgi:propionyl-CoA carboxylase beta chain
MSRRSKKLLSYLQSNKETTAKLPYELNDEVREQLATIIPDNPNKPYDMHGVIAGIIDEDSFMKFIKYAENIIVAFARL